MLNLHTPCAYIGPRIFVQMVGTQHDYDQFFFCLTPSPFNDEMVSNVNALKIRQMHETELQKFYAFSLEICLSDVSFEKYIFQFFCSHLQMHNRKRKVEASWALERAMERTDRRRTRCPPEDLPTNWMRYADASQSITAWCIDLTAATGTEIRLDQNASNRLEMMPYENRHTYLRRLAEAVIKRNVICPSAYLIGMLHSDRFRTDYPWEIYRRPWILPENPCVTDQFIFPFARTWQHSRTPASYQPMPVQTIEEEAADGAEQIDEGADHDPTAELFDDATHIWQAQHSSSSTEVYVPPPDEATLALTPQQQYVQNLPQPPFHQRRRTLVPLNAYRFFRDGETIARSFLQPATIHHVTEQGWTLQKCLTLYSAGGIATLQHVFNLTTDADRTLLELTLQKAAFNQTGPDNSTA